MRMCILAYPSSHNFIWFIAIASCALSLTKRQVEALLMRKRIGMLLEFRVFPIRGAYLKSACSSCQAYLLKELRLSFVL
ncbi:hypothetical protein L6164_006038 [Bauhinia variegata]|uniref:Uncharacterized protein n=1 Tax=Bauhinia variegata TaxID=167791 RepID=A0ACB9PSB3_BAUVA|nr:hypothetical protein L6164_006038 [Bauhinia variegata]